MDSVHPVVGEEHKQWRLNLLDDFGGRLNNLAQVLLRQGADQHDNHRKIELAYCHLPNGYCNNTSPSEVHKRSPYPRVAVFLLPAFGCRLFDLFGGSPVREGLLYVYHPGVMTG